MIVWWKRLTVARRVLFVAWTVCGLGLIGSVIWGWTIFPFLLFLNLVFLAINAVLTFRDWNRPPSKPLD